MNVHVATYPASLPAALGQVEELRREAAELLDRARTFTDAVDAAIRDVTDLLAGPERRDVTGTEFEAAGIHPLMATVHEIRTVLLAVDG